MLWTLKKCWYRIYQRVFKVAMCFMDWSAPQLLEGAGSVLRLPELIKSKGVKKVLVVTDKGLIALHLLDPLFAKLDEVGIAMWYLTACARILRSPALRSVRTCMSKTAARASLLLAAVLRWTALRLPLLVW